MHPLVERLGGKLDEGVYVIEEAAERAGVTPELLRAWERRYGVPLPERSVSGHRLFGGRHPGRALDT